ncbi:MAG: hypothetical protein M1820_008993 [Bogoriella megaspora]|nr:MAG: hypothetical protein M1820_008993 [Bogoriella megaspora]
MAFEPQSGEFGGRSEGFYWPNANSGVYNESVQFDSQPGPNQIPVSNVSGQGDQMNWPQLQTTGPPPIFNHLDVSFDSDLGTNDNRLMHSPSVLGDRRSSAGFISDHGFPDLSNHPSPAYLDEQLTESFAPKLILDDRSVMPHSEDGSSAGGAGPIFAWNASLEARHVGGTQLMSPELTGTSSPASGTGEPVLARTNPIMMNQANFTSGQSSSDISVASGLPQTYAPVQQNSPAPSTSPSNELGIRMPPFKMQLRSPTMIDDEGIRMQHNVSPASHAKSMQKQASSASIRRPTSGAGQKRQNPVAAEDASTDEQHVARLEDGSWIPNSNTGQSGLAPETRAGMSEATVPTIEEMEKHRVLEDRNADVEEWLSNNEADEELLRQRSQLSVPRSDVATRRRARSTTNDQFVFDDSHIPGPGLKIEERSDVDEDWEASSASFEREESAPADIDPLSHAEESVSPTLDHSQTDTHRYNIYPWHDVPKPTELPEERYQPATSNAAMMKFYQRAKDIETASRSATIGSRRHSDTDLESIFSKASGAPVGLGVKQAEKQKVGGDRKGSILNSLRRPTTNLLKRKSTNTVHQAQDVNRASAQRQESDPKVQPSRLTGSLRRPRSPRIDTSARGTHSPHEPSSGLSPNSSLTPWPQVPNFLRRNRSKSDFTREPGLRDLMTQHGGPPVPKLASPRNDNEHLQASLSPHQDFDGADRARASISATSPISMNLDVHFERIVPTEEGFKSHVLMLNPRLEPFLADRIATEQFRRYKKLSDAQSDHAKAVKNGTCSSKERCTGLGGASKLLPLRTNNRNTSTVTAGFQVLASPTSEDDVDQVATSDGLIVPAQFPTGIPIPPASRLPAEFECPLCFKVKQFIKPSDWTKHVHEDVSPFTCTFEYCSETKSFKRKADWVRHENERHRRLEAWKCAFPDCTHSCFRKDNFVQHLVREHDLPEPKVRSGKATSGGVVPGPVQVMGIFYNDIWSLIDACRQDTAKRAEDEPCCFCGNICSSWKKLTVHLAKHLEQISLPILGLLEQNRVGADKSLTIPSHAKSNHDLPQRIDYRNSHNAMQNQEWIAGSAVNTKTGVVPTNAAEFSAPAPQPSNGRVAFSYPPFQFNPSGAANPQPFLQNQPGIFSNQGQIGSGIQYTQQSHAGSMPAQQPLVTTFVPQPQDNGFGSYSNGPPANMGNNQHSFVSSPVEGAGFSDDDFSSPYVRNNAPFQST